MMLKLLIISKANYEFLTDALMLCYYAANNFKYRIKYLCIDTMDYAFTTNKEYINNAHYVVDRVRRKDIKFINNMLWLRRCIVEAKSNRDLIYIYYFPACSIIRILCPNNHFILDIRTGSTNPNLLYRFLRDLLLKFECMFFSNIAVISKNLALHLGIENKSRIIPVGAEFVELTSKIEDVLNLLYVGNLSPVRKVDETILGFAKLCKDNPNLNIKYIIVGDGPSPQILYLKNLVRELGVENRVDFTGWVFHGDLKEYFEKAHIGVSYIPITPWYNRQPPTKTFEYLAAGLPVIATKTDEHLGIICETNGVLIDDTPESFYEGLTAILNKIETYDPILIKSTVSEYSWQVIVNRLTLPFIDSIINKK